MHNAAAAAAAMLERPCPMPAATAGRIGWGGATSA
jgi:hypothetical protein